MVPQLARGSEPWPGVSARGVAGVPGLGGWLEADLVTEGFEFRDQAPGFSNKSCRVRHTADSVPGGRRQVSTFVSQGFEPCRKIVPLPVAGRVDRCWDVVPACWREHSFIRSLIVLPQAAAGFRHLGRENGCGCSWGMTGLRTITTWR